MKYYVIINGQQTGPVEESQLLGMGVTRDTQVWREGMPQWQPAGMVPELGYLFASPQSGTGNYAGYAGGGGYGTPGGAAPQQPPMQPMPKTWLVESILVTIFCCLPFGIVGIVNAAAVSSSYNMGNFALAQEKSNAAKKWTMWGLIAWGIGLVLYVILCLAMAGMGMMGGAYY